MIKFKKKLFDCEDIGLVCTLATMKYFSIICCIIIACFLATVQAMATVRVGADLLFSPMYEPLLLGKKVGLITNQTGINSEGESTIAVFKKNAPRFGYTLDALFAPEHGLNGAILAEKHVPNSRDNDGIPIFSLYGDTRRPTTDMLANLSLLVFDIQDIGARSYTYISTLFYAMEEAVKAHIPVVVLDRPNPLGGLLVDGAILRNKWRSFVGYTNIPYCHGLTIGELAQYFNAEYSVGCQLIVVPMQGWKRSMTFEETGLLWIPTSPHIPESRTPFYYPTTGILGELSLVSIGIGCTFPFRVIGAPWIDSHQLAKELHALKLPGVHFSPYDFTPFFGRFSNQLCHGVLITITDTHHFFPVTTQYSILSVLKLLYPKEFIQALENSKDRLVMFNKVNGSEEIAHILLQEKPCLWKLRSLCKKEANEFVEKRKPYLIPSY